jgi:hypothetical protein
MRIALVTGLRGYFSVIASPLKSGQFQHRAVLVGQHDRVRAAAEWQCPRGLRSGFGWL